MPVVAALIRTVMKAKGLKQSQMAEILGVSVERVKNLAGGRVTKLTPEEARAMVQKLQVRGDYLATGVEPIFQSQDEVKFNASLELLKQATTTVQDLDVSPRYRMLTRDILFSVALKNAETLTTTIDNFVAEQAAPPHGRVADEEKKGGTKK